MLKQKYTMESYYVTDHMIKTVFRLYLLILIYEIYFNRSYRILLRNLTLCAPNNVAYFLWRRFLTFVRRNKQLLYTCKYWVWNRDTTCFCSKDLPGNGKSLARVEC